MVTSTIVILAILFGFLTIWNIRAEHQHVIEHLDRLTNHIESEIHMSQQDAVNAVTAQIKKGTQEVIDRIATLQDQVDAGVPTEDLDLTDLTAAAQALDNIVPDPAPVDAPPADPTA